MSSTLIPSSSFQTVQSVENGVATVRSTSSSSTSNADLLSDFQNVDTIPTVEVSDSFFDENNLPEISSLAALLKELGELFVRFDTTPKNYNKGDFEHLVKIITNSTIHLYQKDQYQGDGIFVDFVGLGDFTLNPSEDAISRGKYFPGIYLLNQVGNYTNFGLEVTESDLAESIVIAKPTILNGSFTGYEKIVYKMTIDLDSLNVTFSEDFIANPTFGKYSKGTIVPATGKTSNALLLDAFSDYINPVISTFTSGLSTTVETSSLVSGLIPFYLTYDYLTNVRSESLAIVEVSSGTTIVDGTSLSPTVVVNIGNKRKYSSGEYVAWRATVLNTKDETINSPLFTVTWRNKVFYGSVDNTPNDSTSVRSLSNTVWDNDRSSISINLNKNKYTIAVPIGMELSSVITQNNENITGNFVKSNVTVMLPDGIQSIVYNVYTFTSSVIMNVTANLILK